MEKYNTLPPEERIRKVIESLKKNGIEAHFAPNAAEAKKKALEIIPAGASIMDMTSVTLETISVAHEVRDSKNYKSVREELMKLNMKTEGAEMKKLGAAPEWTIGSVHAVTENGEALIASATGSQLPAYAYGAQKVLWIVGAQKIVKDMEDGMKRIYEHSLPLESERAKKAYGVPGSSVNKILIVNKEHEAGRVQMILVNEILGF
jgi:hypothetical protein